MRAYGRFYDRLLKSLLLSIALILVVVGLASAQAATDYSFDADSAGWSCHWSDGYLWPEPLCSSPAWLGDWLSLAAVVSLRGDTDGIATARFVDLASGLVLCESHSAIAAGASLDLRLFCPAFRGSFRLDVVEGGGDFLIDYVRIDVVTANPTSTPTNTPVPTNTPTPTNTSVPTVVPYNYPAGGSYTVGSIIPPTPVPTIIVDCRVYLRVYEAAGLLYSLPVDVEFLSDKTASFNVSGFAVLTVPCGESFVSVRDKGGALLSDPFFVRVGPMDSLDLGVRVPLPTPTAVPAVATSAPLPGGFDFGFLQPPAGVSVSTSGERLTATPTPTNTPVPTNASPVDEEEQPRRAGILPAWADWPPLLGIALVGLLVLRIVAFVRSRRTA